MNYEVENHIVSKPHVSIAIKITSFVYFLMMMRLITLLFSNFYAAFLLLAVSPIQFTTFIVVIILYLFTIKGLRSGKKYGIYLGIGMSALYLISEAFNFTSTFFELGNNWQKFSELDFYSFTSLILIVINLILVIYLIFSNTIKKSFQSSPKKVYMALVVLFIFSLIASVVNGVNDVVMSEYKRNSEYKIRL